jgi:hypothetical protein
MPKTERPVSKPHLVQAIAEAEGNGPLSNRVTLYEAAALIYNLDLPEGFREITFSIVMKRIVDWKLVIKTPVGKRGRAPGSGIPKGLKPGKRVGRRAKFAKSSVALKSVAHIRADLKANNQERFLPLVERIEGGSMKAAVQLNCIQCMGYNQADVKRCGCVGCPFYAFMHQLNLDEPIGEENPSELVEAAA